MHPLCDLGPPQWVLVPRHRPPPPPPRKRTDTKNKRLPRGQQRPELCLSPLWDPTPPGCSWPRAAHRGLAVTRPCSGRMQAVWPPRDWGAQERRAMAKVASEKWSPLMRIIPAGPGSPRCACHTRCSQSPSIKAAGPPLPARAGFQPPQASLTSLLTLGSVSTHCSSLLP